MSRTNFSSKFPTIPHIPQPVIDWLYDQGGKLLGVTQSPPQPSLAPSPTANATGNQGVGGQATAGSEGGTAELKVVVINNPTNSNPTNNNPTNNNPTNNNPTNNNPTNNNPTNNAPGSATFAPVRPPVPDHASAPKVAKFDCELPNVHLKIEVPVEKKSTVDAIFDLGKKCLDMPVTGAPEKGSPPTPPGQPTAPGTKEPAPIAADPGKPPPAGDTPPGAKVAPTPAPSAAPVAELKPPAPPSGDKPPDVHPPAPVPTPPTHSTP